MIIKLGDFIGYISTVSEIYIRIRGGKFSKSLVHFMKSHYDWYLYEVQFIQPDNNDVILEVTPPL